MNRRRILIIPICLIMGFVAALAFSRYAVSQGLSDGWRDTPPALFAGLLIIWLACDFRQARRNDVGRD